LNLGKAFAAKRDFSAAENELRSALALDPTSAAAHMNLGLVLAAKDARLSADAQMEMEKGVRLDPRLKDLIPQQYLADVH
jgi:Flp pilus assembly protein TadD